MNVQVPDNLPLVVFAKAMARIGYQLEAADGGGLKLAPVTRERCKVLQLPIARKDPQPEPTPPAA